MAKKVATKYQRVTKDEGDQPDDDDANSEFQASLTARPATVAQATSILKDLYGDSYLAGVHAAADQLGGAAVITSDLDGVLAPMSWDSWEPGYAAAADKVSGTGLSELLDQADITIKGVTKTNLERMGNALAQGLSQGLGPDEIGRTIRDLTTSAGNSQAQLISVTETARAQSAGTLDTFTDSGITQFDGIAESDACPVCLDWVDENPHDLGDEVPPIHPRCRCAIAAVVNTSASSAPVDDEDDSDDD